ncbi:MAG: HAMP domain-containing sensor histidine kinase [Paracoccaceae bacterium]
MRLRGINLRLRLSAGAVVLATLAIIAAFLAAYGVSQALWLGNEAAAAQRRIDAYGTLSAHITEVILTPPAQRSVAESTVMAGFSGLDQMVVDDVAAVQGDASLSRAAQSLAVARMRGAFLRLTQDLNRTAQDQTGQNATSDAALNSFAQVFSPLMRDQVNINRQRRDVALTALEALRQRMVTVSVGVALAVTAVLLLLYFLLIRPLLARLATATHAIGLTTADARPTKLLLGPRDELALLFARLNQMIARLDRRRASIAADRAQLEMLVSERTAALETANARLAQTDENRRRFFADVSHELRTPLTVILAEAELGAAACPAGLEATFGTIRARAARLNRRIEDLLRIARSDTGQLELDPRPTDIGTVLDAAAEDLRPLLNRSRFTVERHKLGAAMAQADPDWLRQIAGGIIGNAVKYAGPGATLHLTSGTDAGASFFEITDTGPGLSVADRNAAPARFANGANPVAGSFGIGLSLARWVTEAQGGKLSLVSPVADGRGFAVRIALPQITPKTDRPRGQEVHA